MHYNIKCSIVVEIIIKILGCFVWVYSAYTHGSMVR